MTRTIHTVRQSNSSTDTVVVEEEEEEEETRRNEKRKKETNGYSYKEKEENCLSLQKNHVSKK